MNRETRKYIKLNICLTLVASIVTCWWSSCGKSNVTTAAGSKTRILIVNASPDGTLPVGVFVNTTQLGASAYYYPTPSSYYSIGSGPQLIQARLENLSNINLTYNNFYSVSDTLKINTNYSLFLIGLSGATVRADSLSGLLVADTTLNPASQGRAKFRFVDVSPHTTGIDVFANGTLAFSNMAYKSVSNYIELPVGTYDFKVSPHSASATTLTDLPHITLLDGKLYTLFIHGLVGRTDAQALGATVILNQ